MYSFVIFDTMNNIWTTDVTAYRNENKMIKRKQILTVLVTMILIVSGAAAVRAESGLLSESE